MDQPDIKTIHSLHACPSCGGKMELSADEEKATCPYCGHEMLIDKEEPAQQEYNRRMAQARADEDIKDLQKRRQRKRHRLKGLAHRPMRGRCYMPGWCVLVPGSRCRCSRSYLPVPVMDCGGVVKFSGMSVKPRLSYRSPTRSAQSLPIQLDSKSSREPAFKTATLSRLKRKPLPAGASSLLKSSLQ